MIEMMVAMELLKNWTQAKTKITSSRSHSASPEQHQRGLAIESIRLIFSIIEGREGDEIPLIIPDARLQAVAGGGGVGDVIVTRGPRLIWLGVMIRLYRPGQDMVSEFPRVRKP